MLYGALHSKNLENKKYKLISYHTVIQHLNHSGMGKLKNILFINKKLLKVLNCQSSETITQPH